jgi:hypothetical protein
MCFYVERRHVYVLEPDALHFLQLLCYLSKCEGLISRGFTLKGHEDQKELLPVLNLHSFDNLLECSPFNAFLGEFVILHYIWFGAPSLEVREHTLHIIRSKVCVGASKVHLHFPSNLLVDALYLCQILSRVSEV